MERGYIFDLDGVITDTSEFHYRAWQQLADEEGIPFNREANEALRGVPRRRSLELLLDGRFFPEDKMQEMMERKNRYYQAFLEEITPANLLPGVEVFLAEIKSTGACLGLASASKNARHVCDRLRILGLFDGFGDGNSVINAKPAPDIFVWVAGRMGLNPQQCIIFEDAAAGIEAALTGGFWTVGIGPKSRVGQAHRIRENLAGARVAEFNLPL